ncbi:MAG: hypothetical protein RL274_1027 [Pseudomonadota bacterium]|jgi:gluconolactonase
MTDFSRRLMLTTGLSLVGMASFSRSVFSQAPGATPTARIERLDPSLDALIDADAPVEAVMDGYQWAEGPVWIGGADGFLLASDPPKNVIFQWSPKSGGSVWLQPSGYQGPPTPRLREAGSNGLFLGRGGLLIADSGNRCISQIDIPTKTRSVIVDRFEGKRLNSPNDLCVSPIDGSIYFTDPAYGLTGTDKSPDRELNFTGVFRIAPDNSITLIGKYNAPNGIGVSPDGRRLYHTDRDMGWVVHELDAQGRSTSSRAFIDRTAQGFKSTSGDGFKVDQAGNVWLSGDGISIVNPQGKRIGVIRISGPAANCELGADGYLYIAANKHLMRVKVKAGKLRA